MQKLYPIGSAEELTYMRSVYSDALFGLRTRLPADFFTVSIERGKARAKILFADMIANNMADCAWTVEEMYDFFASAEGASLISKKMLMEPLRLYYDCDPLLYLHDVLGDYQDEGLLSCYSKRREMRLG